MTRLRLLENSQTCPDGDIWNQLNHLNEFREEWETFKDNHIALYKRLDAMEEVGESFEDIPARVEKLEHDFEVEVMKKMEEIESRMEANVAKRLEELEEREKSYKARIGALERKLLAKRPPAAHKLAPVASTPAALPTPSISPRVEAASLAAAPSLVLPTHPSTVTPPVVPPSTNAALCPSDFGVGQVPAPPAPEVAPPLVPTVGGLLEPASSSMCNSFPRVLIQIRI